MKKTFSRFLAVTLAVAMVLTCAISGFVLPVAAEGTPTFGVNLNANADKTATLTYAKDTYYSEATGTQDAYQREINFNTSEPLVVGERYVLRFEGKGVSTSMSIHAGTGDNGWNNLFSAETNDWRAYQVSFVVHSSWTSRDNQSSISFYIELTDLENTEGVFEARNFEILYAPKDGTFNIVPGGDMELGGATDLFHRQLIDESVEVVTDPLDPNNKVLHMLNGSHGSGTSYIDINSNEQNSAPGVFKHFDYTQYILVRMRVKGHIYFQCWGSGVPLSNPTATTPAAAGSSGSAATHYNTGSVWKTIEYYYDINNNIQYFGIYNTGEAWIDDIEIYEVSDATSIQLSDISLFPGMKAPLAVTATPKNAYPGTFTVTSDNAAFTGGEGTVTVDANAAVGTTATITATAGNVSDTCTATVVSPAQNQHIYFENNVVKVPATKGTTYDILPQLKTTIPGYNPTVTMTIQGGKANTWDSTAQTWTNTEKEIVKVSSGTKVQIVADGMSASNGTFALNRVQPTITLTDAYGNTAVAAVEWVWPTRVTNIDFEAGSHTIKNAFKDANAANGEVITDSTGNNVLHIPAGQKIGYFDAFQVTFKPNTTYRLTFRSKSSDTTGTNQFKITSFSGVDITLKSQPATVTKTTEWATSAAYIVTGDNPALAGNWVVNFNYVNFSSTNDVYIDDLFIDEVDTTKPEFYFEGGVIKVPAVPGSYDIAEQAITEQGYKPTATWTISDNSTTVYGSNKDWTGATKTDGVTLSGSTLKVAGPSGSNAGGAWSLARVNPTISVTDAFGHVITTKVEWVWPKTPLHIDFDTVEPSNTTMKGAIVTEEGTTNKVMSVDTTAGWSEIWFQANYHLKPNAKYRMSLRTKVAEGDTTSSVRYIFDNRVDLSVSATNGAQAGALSVADGSGEWITSEAIITTGNSPAVYASYMHYFAVIGKQGTVLVDDLRIDLIEEGENLVLGSDFEDRTLMSYRFDRHATYVVNTAEIGGNTGTKIELPGDSASVSFGSIPVFSALRANHIYEISFKHYGGAGTFAMTTWQDLHVAGGGSITLTANTNEWKTYTMLYMPGVSISNSGNWGEYFRFTTTTAESLYFDDFEVREIDEALYLGKANAYGDENFVNGTVKLTVNGTTVSPGGIVKDVAGKVVTATVTPKAGYLPIPGTLKVYGEDDSELAILNTALTGMSESAGNQFVFKAPAGTAYVTCEFAAVASDVEAEYIGQGYQWGTVGSAVHRDKDQNNAIDGLRFLNRLYIDGLDWSASALKTTIDGEEYTIMEIGAKARAYDADAATTLFDDETALKGICYEDGNPNVKVTDYTKQYFDFTVVISITDESKHDVVYECGSYMVLEDAEGNTKTVYTEPMQDSVNAAVGRGA